MTHDIKLSYYYRVKHVSLNWVPI